MSAKAPKKRIQIIGVRRSAVDIERLAAAIIGLAQHLRDARQEQSGSGGADLRLPLPPKEGL
jgi:hypothetical protein